MKCPVCGLENVRTVERRDYRNTFRRRKICKDCGRRFTTYEIIREEIEEKGKAEKTAKPDSITMNDIVIMQKEEIRKVMDAEIVELRGQGKTYQEIANYFECTRQNIHQRYTGTTEAVK